MTHEEPAEKHALACALWLSPDPLDACDCGADAEARDERNPHLARPTTAQRLDRIHPSPVPLACDTDPFEETA